MHTVKMSTGSLYPCSCKLGHDHNYSDSSIGDILKQLANEVPEE